MTDLEKLIFDSINADAARVSSPVIIELERHGDAAYTLIKSLIASGRLRAELLPATFRCLTAISKHQGIARASDLLSMILPFTRHEDAAVRTAAAHHIVWSGFDERRARQLGVGGPTKTALIAAVRTALKMGVEARFRASFERYVSSS